MIDAFKEKLTESLRYYYCVGGMPESVVTFMETKDLGKVRTFQKELLEAYERDFSKHAGLPRTICCTGIAPQVKTGSDPIHCAC